MLRAALSIRIIIRISTSMKLLADWRGAAVYRRCGLCPCGNGVIQSNAGREYFPLARRRRLDRPIGRRRSGERDRNVGLDAPSGGRPDSLIWAAGNAETADLHLAALEEAGAPTGYLVDVQTEDDDTFREQLSQAGMIILGDGPDIGALRGGIAGAALDGMAQAYARGAMILAIGAGAAVLGQKFWLGIRRAPDFRGWKKRSWFRAIGRAGRRTAALRIDPASTLFGLGISLDSALALGPDGQVELGCPYLT